MKSYLRRSKASKSTIRRVEIILRRGFYRRKKLAARRCDAAGVER